MGDLLINLQVRKSTADAEGAKTFYEDLTEPIDEWTRELRQLVLFKKQPRKIFVQVWIHAYCCSIIDFVLTAQHLCG
jgi:dipeptidyl-peptidase III